jgi:hypothetical protein
MCLEKSGVSKLITRQDFDPFPGRGISGVKINCKGKLCISIAQMFRIQRGVREDYKYFKVRSTDYG